VEVAAAEMMLDKREADAEAEVDAEEETGITEIKMIEIRDLKLHLLKWNLHKMKRELVISKLEMKAQTKISLRWLPVSL